MPRYKLIAITCTVLPFAGIIVAGGCGAVCAHKFAGGTPMLSIAAAFGTSVMLGVYMTGHISGAHLNPAVTVSLAVNNPTAVPAETVGPYVAAQCAGATIAGAINYLMFQNGIAALEASQKVCVSDNIAGLNLLHSHDRLYVALLRALLSSTVLLVWYPTVLSLELAVSCSPRSV
jgi:glycerol uptake facilitator protein